MPEAISGLPLTPETQVQLQTSSVGIFGEQSGNGRLFTCQYHTTNSSYLFSARSPTLYPLILTTGGIVKYHTYK